MSEHKHLWVHRTTLGGTVIERCYGCGGRARRPLLTPAEAQENDLKAMSAIFKKAYGGSIMDLVPRTSPLAAIFTWRTHSPLGQELETPRTIITRNGAITHVDGVRLSWVTDA